MSPDPLYDTAHPGAVPTAILSSQSVEDWFVAPTRHCATGKGTTTGARFNNRYALSATDQDPVKLIPENCSVLKAWADFMPDLQPNLNSSGSNDVVVLVVNRLTTPLTISMEGKEPIHGKETAYPARRSWDARHKHHVWDNPTDGYTIPAGNHRDKTCGVGLMAISRNPGLRGAGAVWSVSAGPDDPNLTAPLWFVAASGFGTTDGRHLGVYVTDDLGAYDDAVDFYDRKYDQSATAYSSCTLAAGDDVMHPDANYTVSAYIAMLDPTPTGMIDLAMRDPSHAGTEYLDRRTRLYTAQAVLVLDTDGSGVSS